MDVRGCRVGTEVAEKGGRAQPNSGALCSYTRHWESHSNTFTHSHNNTAVHTSACFCPLPHRIALASGRAAPSPVQSWVLKWIEPCLLQCNLPPRLKRSCSPDFLWNTPKSQGHHSLTTDLHQLRTSGISLQSGGARPLIHFR